MQPDLTPAYGYPRQIPQRMNMNGGEIAKIDIVSVADMHRFLSNLMEIPNCGSLPLLISDGRASYPFGMHTTLSPSGYRDRVLIQPMPWNQFKEDNPLYREARRWNEEAMAARQACGTFHY